MDFTYLDYYMQTINEEHVSSILNKSESEFNLLCMTLLEKEMLIDEMFETRQDFVRNYFSTNENFINIDWVYNKKGLLEDLIQYLNTQYRSQRIQFFILNNQIILRKNFRDIVLKQYQVLKFYFNIKYRIKLEELTEETIEKFQSIILK
jgi:hypothetical protein